jgi:hypothetical protein
MHSIDSEVQKNPTINRGSIKKRNTQPKLITVLKGTKVQLNKEWGRANGGDTPWQLPVGRKGEVTGIATSSNCVKVQFEGNKTSQTFHINFLDVQQ